MFFVLFEKFIYSPNAEKYLKIFNVDYLHEQRWKKFSFSIVDQI